MARPKLHHQTKVVTFTLPLPLFEQTQAFATERNISANELMGRMIRLGVMALDRSETGTEVVFRSRADGKEITPFFL